MASLPSPEVRRLRSRMGGFALAAQADPLAYTEAARRIFRDSFAERVRAEAETRGEQLGEREIARRAEALRRAHYARLALLSVHARTRRLKRETVSTRSLAETVQEVSADGSGRQESE